MLEILAWTFLVLALAGSAYQLVAGTTVLRFRGAAPSAAAATPDVSILKPLCGAELGLDKALASFLDQDYRGRVQVIFGVQDPDDPARATAEALRRTAQGCETALTANSAMHGTNRKISNLINMMGEARHDVIVLADSDIVAGPDYLRRVAAALEAPGVGVVTCPYYGVAMAGFWSRLAAAGITYQFMPGVAAGVALRIVKPCMGSTIALRRETLERIGGFEAFTRVLEDDFAIGAAVRDLGLESVVAPLLVGHGCNDTSLRELMRRELRIAAINLRIEPVGYVGSIVTHATPLALLGVLLSLASPASLAVLAVTLATRLWMLHRVDKSIGQPGRWALALGHDMLSFAVFAASFFTRTVEWRGARFRVDARGELRRVPSPSSSEVQA